MTKRILSLVLAILTMFALCAPAFASAEPAEEPAADVAEEVPVTEDIPVIEEAPEAAPEEAPVEDPVPEEAPEVPAVPEEALPEEAPAEEPSTEPEIVGTGDEPEETEALDEPEETVALSGVLGPNMTWKATKNGGKNAKGEDTYTITISGSGPMPDHVFSTWFELRDVFTEAVIESGVTSIGPGAFTSSTSLTRISIPSTVKTIGSSAFNGCVSLTDAVIPEGVTSIGSSAFTLTALTSLTIPSSVTDIADAFNSCEKLTSITIKNGLTTIGDTAFLGCKKLTKVTIPESVTHIGEAAFYGCHSLKDITIPKSVKNIEQDAFYDCGAIRVKILNPFCRIGYYSGDLENGSFDGTILGYEGSTAKEYAVAHDFAFQSLGDPPKEGACGGNVTWSFSNGTLTISGKGEMDYEPADYNYGAPWQYYAQSIRSVVIKSGVTSVHPAAFSYYDTLTSVTLSDTVTAIWDGAFAGTGLTSVTLPASVKTVEAYAFSDCGKLARVTVMAPDCDISQYGDPDGEWFLGTMGNPGTATIYGYIGSTAETYAKEYGYAFQDINSAPVEKNGPVTENGKTYYYVDGVKQTGLVSAGSRVFYYCSPTDGHILKSGWVTVNGKNKYYADKDGKLYTGYCAIGSKNYYFSVNDAHLMKGGVVTGPGNKQYYVSAKDGHAMKGGWARGKNIKNSKTVSYYYYLDSTGVVRVTKQLPTSTKIGSLAVPKPSEYQN